MARYKSSKPHKRNSGNRNKPGGSSRQHSKSGSAPNRAAGPKPGSNSFSAGEQIEGRHAVRELLIAGKRRVQAVNLIDGQEEADILEDIVSLAEMQGVSVRELPRKKFEAIAQTTSHQGVLAQAAPIEFVSLDELMQNPDAFIIVLDGITDPQNFGSILRVAECAGVTGVVITERRSVRVTPTVTKTAAGALEHVPICQVAGIPSALLELQKNEMLTVGLDAAGEIDLFDDQAPLERPIAVVMGKEGSGLSKLVRQRVDKLLSIPLLGQLNSLNVSTATAIACFEVVRRQSTERR